MPCSLWSVFFFFVLFFLRHLHADPWATWEKNNSSRLTLRLNKLLCHLWDQSCMCAVISLCFRTGRERGGYSCKVLLLCQWGANDFVLTAEVFRIKQVVFFFLRGLISINTSHPWLSVIFVYPPKCFFVLKMRYLPGGVPCINGASCRHSIIVTAVCRLTGRDIYSMFLFV